ncbi:MAG: four helix bundle protein, partial [Candidatus Omnitrophota bacterium]
MVYQPKNPVGYKQLLTWQQAGRIICLVKDFARKYLFNSTDKRLTNHLIDSARSVQRNIEEGYKRATTREYVEFLGFSRGSLEELKGDFEELKRETKGRLRHNAKWLQEEIETLLTLIYGEDCMLGRQLKGLETKMVKEKILPASEAIKGVWKQKQSADDKFWKIAKEKFGVIRDEKNLKEAQKEIAAI